MGKHLRKLGKDRAKSVLGIKLVYGNNQPVLHPAFQRAGNAYQMFAPVQHHTGLAQQALAFSTQHRSAPCTHEQDHPQIHLQIGNMRAYGRLRPPQSASCCGKRPRIHRGHKGLKLFE